MENNVYELLYMSHLNDYYAEEALFNHYDGLLHHIVQSTVNGEVRYLTYEADLVQEAWIGLATAIERYRNDCNANFSTFLCVVVRRKLWQFIRNINAKDVAMQGDIIYFSEGENYQYYVDGIAQNNAMYDPSFYMHYKDAEERYNKVIESLSDKERDILEQWMSGKTYEEAAKALNIKRKSFDFQKAKLKKKIYSAVLNNEEEDTN